MGLFTAYNQFEPLYCILHEGKGDLPVIMIGNLYTVCAGIKSALQQRTNEERVIGTSKTRETIQQQRGRE